MSSVCDNYWSRDYHDDTGSRVLLLGTRFISEHTNEKPPSSIEPINLTEISEFMLACKVLVLKFGISAWTRITLFWLLELIRIKLTNTRQTSKHETHCLLPSPSMSLSVLNLYTARDYCRLPLPVVGAMSNTDPTQTNCISLYAHFAASAWERTKYFPSPQIRLCGICVNLTTSIYFYETL